MINKKYLDSIKNILGEEYKDFIRALDKPPFRGLFVNTLKADKEKFLNVFPYELKPTPFAENGYYIESREPMGTNPLHHAGAFYMQEPSAMSVVTAADIQENEKVLDLCAAPGGKSINAACALKSTGILWSNEINKSRASILLSNIERMGIKNAVVSSCSPEQLAEQLPGFFDKVIVDAPCSGEGMLRREKADYDDWSEENIYLCADRQEKILNCAARLVRPGGTITYSTCTFNTTENEKSVSNFLSLHSDFSPQNTPVKGTRSGVGMPFASRIFPMDGGEGHFVTNMKKSESGDVVKYKAFTPSKIPPELKSFWEQTMNTALPENLIVIGNKVFCPPKDFPQTGLKGIIRAGVFLGEVGKNRFIPSHNLFTAFNKDEFKNRISFDIDDEKLKRYLHGEEIAAEGVSGYTVVCVEGISLGGGKASCSKLKNHYPKGLRNLK